MNWQHLRAFFWLRLRLRVNQLKRGGIANIIVLVVLAVGAFLLATGLFIGFFLTGYFVPAREVPMVVLFIWDGLIVAFLFFWAIGLLAELQRAEALSLDKFLHLPVSVLGAFLLNYVSSLLSLNVIIFVPAMIGFCLGLVIADGALLLLSLPLLASFIFMVTAVTYQFQGWLAALMVNKRRRRTIIVIMTLTLVVVANLPTILRFHDPSSYPFLEKQNDLKKQRVKDETKLRQSLSAGEISNEKYLELNEEIARHYKAQMKESDHEIMEEASRIGRLANGVLPPGWLALGSMAAIEGSVLPGLLGMIGMTAIGSASLWRAYRTTLRLYTGQYTSGKLQKVVTPPTGKPRKPTAGLVEADLPLISEHASAIALACFRSLLRAPEAKMMFLTPVILTLIFGSMFVSRHMEPPQNLRPLMAFGAMSTALLGMVQLVGNQFGFDRGGFRVFVLCAASRRDILLGKNLAFAPLAITLALAAVGLVEIFYPLRLDHLLALGPQTITMYLLLCLLGNVQSMLAPMPIASGSMKPSNPKLVPVLLQLLFFLLLSLVLFPSLLPLGIELLLEFLELAEGVPIFLILSLVECAAVGYFYHVALTWEGTLLQSREQRILEIVTTKAE